MKLFKGFVQFWMLKVHSSSVQTELNGSVGSAIQTSEESGQVKDVL